MASERRVQKLVGHLRPHHVSNQSFEFTTGTNDALSPQQRAFYEENGFIVLKALISGRDVSTFYDRFDYLVHHPKQRLPEMIVMRDVALEKVDASRRTEETTVTKIQNWSRDDVLWRFASHPSIVRCVEAIIGGDIRAHHFMAINKPKDPGLLSSRHPLHQDAHAFPFTPFSRIVCAWTALQRVERNNGCLCVVPGSHRTALLEHRYPRQWTGPVNRAYHGLQCEGDLNALLRKRVHLEMDPGDTVLFHPLLVHGSGANLSGRNRRSISTHYVNSREVSFVSLPQQKEIKAEIEALIKKRSGVEMDFVEFWKRKSRQIQGDAGNWK